MYKSEIDKPPWRLSKDPIDVVIIAVVEGDFTRDEMDQQIAIVVNHLKSNKRWVNIIKEKAERRNISVDSMLYLDAKWLIDQKRNK